MQIFINDKPFSVLGYYRQHGFAELPPTPTMSGIDIIIRAGSPSDYNLIEEGEDGKWLRDIQDRHRAIPLKNGMRFATYPPCGF